MLTVLSLGNCRGFDVKIENFVELIHGTRLKLLLERMNETFQTNQKLWMRKKEKEREKKIEREILMKK